MVKALALAAVLLGPLCSSAEKTLNITWSDCGSSSTHGHIKEISFKPDPPILGQPVIGTGTGIIDEAITSGDYTATVKVGPITVITHKASFCGESTFDLKFLGIKVGTVDIHGPACPLAQGPVTIGIGLTLSDKLPANVASATVSMTAVDQKGESIVCLNVHGVIQNGEDAKAAITQELVDEVNSKQSSWTAHMSQRFETATLGDIKALCGTFMKGEPGYVNELEEKHADETWLSAATIPADFDVRTQWPKCANVSGDIRDQSACGSCWAFGSTEAFNDRHCIATGETTLLSPTDTVGNCGFISCFSMGCGGGHPGMAWKWFTKTGVVSGGDYTDVGKGDTCAPYPFQACAHHVTPSPQYPACPTKEYKTPEIGSKCSEASYTKEYSADKRKAATSYSLSSVEKIQQDMIQYGSVTAAFTVYADFPAYKTGVYKHVSGSQLGGHAIKIVGWGTENGQDYWTVANSWNPTWGDKGLFKIARGTNECGIEGMVSAGTVSSPVQQETAIIV